MAEPYRCINCGQEWDTHPFWQVPCPVCGAAVGKRCRRPSEHSGPFVETHVEREQLALDQGLIELCPAGPTARAKQQQAAEPVQQLSLL